METLRKHRLKELQNSVPKADVRALPQITAIYGENVFTLETAEKYLTKEAIKELKSAMYNHHKIDRDMADRIANGLKVWAMSRGVTHYTHWFQPLTGRTAEKHDTFFSLDFASGKGIEKLDGDTLIQQEPDASSFPSGGLRATFEARGYTAWDPSSPAFIIESDSKTLCIPTVFISYSGASLDYKAPLLRSCAALNKVAVDVAHLFDKNVTRVTPTLGWEQEYFLVDAGLAQARPDLVMSHRTVVGNFAARNQQLEDHYFGSIPKRIFDFMQEFEYESYRLGIPLKTRHNEVAPAQFECAPIFEEVSVAVDHNVLLMDVMDRVAAKHNLMVIFHEKPFAGINGSGKHNNWSMSTDTGINLLAPGKTPKSNLMFLTFFVNTIKAVHKHARLLQASIASAGNDHRLGANEAPPGIISIFIGSFLTKVLQDIEERVGDHFDEQDQQIFKIDIHKNIPEVLLDNTDRNRTSPFAFTGNKFEFRAVGSSANCAYPMTVMNAIMADTLDEFLTEVKALMEKGEKKESAILHVLRSFITQSKNILFEGDGYSESWVKEAAKRGLPNITSAPEGIEGLISKESEKLFSKHHILNKQELHARYEIELDKYVKKVEIEATILIEILQTNIIPVCITAQQNLAQAIQRLKEVGIDGKQTEHQQNLLRKMTLHLNHTIDNVEKLKLKKTEIERETSIKQVAIRYKKELLPFFISVRSSADELELLVDDQLWRLPKYRELLFVR